MSFAGNIGVDLFTVSRSDKRLSVELISKSKGSVFVGRLGTTGYVAGTVGDLYPTEPGRFLVVGPFKQIDRPIFEGPAV